MELTVKEFRSLPMKKETIIEVIDANKNKLASGVCSNDILFNEIDNRHVVGILCQTCKSTTIMADVMEAKK